MIPPLLLRALFCSLRFQWRAMGRSGELISWCTRQRWVAAHVIKHEHSTPEALQAANGKWASGDDDARRAAAIGVLCFSLSFSLSVSPFPLFPLYLSLCIRLHIRTHIHTDRHAYMYILTHTHAFEYTYIHTCICKYMFLCMCMCICVCMCMHACVYTRSLLMCLLLRTANTPEHPYVLAHAHTNTACTSSCQLSGG